MIKNTSKILLSFLLISCSNQQEKMDIVKKDTTQPILIEQLEKELPYYDSTTMSKAGEEGYQDTFSIDKSKFRVIHHDSLYDGIVQKLENGKWIEVLQFENLGNYNDYYVNKDLNNDGFNDICLEWKWDMETFFYNTKTKSFNKKSLRLPSSWALLDKSKNLYCNYQSTKTANATSELYRIKDFEKEVISYIDFVANKEDDLELEKAILYKGKTKIEELKLNKDEEFDYVQWWTENYKRFE